MSITVFTRRDGRLIKISSAVTAMEFLSNSRIAAEAARKADVYRSIAHTVGGYSVAGGGRPSHNHFIRPGGRRAG